MNRFAAAIAAILLILSAASVASAVELAAHRAFYRLSLGSASNESNMAGVEGAISFEIKDACDAWIVEQNYALRFQLANGGDVDNVDKFVSWESKDGLEYRFNVTRITNGQETEQVGGRAELESRGGPGMATFEQDTCCLNVLDADVIDGQIVRRYIRLLNMTPYNLTKHGKGQIWRNCSNYSGPAAFARGRAGKKNHRRAP